MNKENISILHKFKSLYKDWISDDINDIHLTKEAEMARLEVYTIQGTVYALNLEKMKDYYYESQANICDSSNNFNELVSIFQKYEYEELLLDLFSSYTDKPDVELIHNIFTKEALNRIELLNNRTLDTYTLDGKIYQIEKGDYIIEIFAHGVIKLLVFNSMNSMIDFLRFHYPAHVLQPDTSNTISDFEYENGSYFFETFDCAIKVWENQSGESSLLDLLNSLGNDSYSQNLSINWFGRFKDYFSGITPYSRYVKETCESDSDAFMNYIIDDMCINDYYAHLKPYLEMPFESTMDMDKDEKIQLFDWLNLQFNCMKERLEYTKFKTLKVDWYVKLDSIEKELKNWRKSELYD
jgi:hypothetical protein